MQDCSLGLIKHHHLRIGSAEPVTRNEDFVSTTYSTASGAARPRRAAVCSKNDTAAMLDYYLYLCFHVTAIPQCGQEPPPARVATILTTGPVVHMGAPCHRAQIPSGRTEFHHCTLVRTRRLPIFPAVIVVRTDGRIINFLTSEHLP